MAAPVWFELIAFVLGLVSGSFLNVCIARVPRGESVVRPGSRCLVCGRPIRWYDNVPVLSFVLLRGRCRDCKTQIPLRYPVVEMAMGLWLAVVARIAFDVQLRPSSAIELIALAVLGFLLLGLMVMDWKTQRLPDAFTLTGIALGFFLLCGQTIFLNPGEGQILLPAEHMRLRSPGSGAVEGNVFMTGPEALVLGRVGAIVAAGLLLLGIRAAYRRVRGREGMGLGDVKLLAMIAAFLGLAQSLLALFVAVVAAAFYASVLLALGRAGPATRLPFGSFLAGGGLFAALFGSGALGWYLGFFR